MSDHDLPPELIDTDIQLRTAIGGPNEPASPAHLQRIRMALIAETQRREKRARRDWWAPAGVLGVLTVGALGTSAPILVGCTFALAVAWSYFSVNLTERPSPPEHSSA